MSREDAPEFANAKCCFYCLNGDNFDCNSVWCMKHKFNCTTYDHCEDYWNKMKDEDIIKYLKKHKHCKGLYCFECPVYDTDECIILKGLVKNEPRGCA